jgi:23S rRNA pseudouridine2605 synthase
MSLGTTVKKEDAVTVNGEIISLPEPKTILFNKPPGIITSTHDTHERLTVMDYLPPALLDIGVLPIGRLDRETEGLLLLTNDGNFSQRMAHPRFEIEKTYRAELRSSLSPEGEMLLVRGIRLEDGPTAPAKLRVVSKRRRRVDITIHEGRNRIVRRMFASVGSPVTRLRRISFGTLNLDDVPKGRWRELQGKEVDALLKRAAEMGRPKRRQRPTGSVGERGGGGNRASGTRRRATSGARRS